MKKPISSLALLLVLVFFAARSFAAEAIPADPVLAVAPIAAEICESCSDGELDVIKIEQADALASKLLALLEKLERLTPHQKTLEQIPSLDSDTNTQDINVLLATMASVQRSRVVTKRPARNVPAPKPQGLTGLIPAFAEAGKGNRLAQAGVVSHGTPIPLAYPGSSFVHNGTRYSFVDVKHGARGEDLTIVLSSTNGQVELQWVR